MTNEKNHFQGKVAGSFLLGLQASFQSLNVLPQGGFNLGMEEIDPNAWYPYGTFIALLEQIENTLPSQTVLFEAGKQFLRIWYESGPGKEMIRSTTDWLYANQSSGGYNTVVTGGSPDQVGWCNLKDIDLESGYAIYENVTPLKGQYLRGLFYGGCVLFNDVEYVDVTDSVEPYPLNPLFTRTMLTVKFKLKDPVISKSLDQKLSSMSLTADMLTPEEIDILIWRCRGLEIQRTVELNYNREISPILANAVTTVQKNAAELLIEKQKAEQANIAKSQFLATMSHEIRTPLNGLLGMAQLLMDENTTPSDRETFISVIYNSGNSLLTILNDILDLSKVEAGKVEIEQLNIFPCEIVNETATLFKEQASAKGLKIKAITSALTSQCYTGDPNRLRQMLSNLTNNAVKFTRKGSITISVEESENSGLNFLEFSVADTGIGIPMEKMDRLFNPFSQVDASTTREYGGSGLGLSIVLRFAETMGGTAGVESSQGTGSRFWFRIPSMPVTGVYHSKGVIIPHSNIEIERRMLHDQLVWVAEDNRINQILITSVLKKFQIRHEVFDNGRAMLDMIEQEMFPDLILMDCQMPIMDGYETAEKIRVVEKAAGMRRIPIIALTANSFSEDKVRCENAGMDDVISKPFNIETLQNTLLERLLHENNYPG